MPGWILPQGPVHVNLCTPLLPQMTLPPYTVQVSVRCLLSTAGSLQRPHSQQHGLVMATVGTWLANDLSVSPSLGIICEVGRGAGLT